MPSPRSSTPAPARAPEAIARQLPVRQLRPQQLRGPHFTYSEIYVTKKIPLAEHVAFRFDTQLFNVFNHPNFALPSNQAGTPGEPATQTGFGAITSTISPPTGLLGVGLGGDSSPRMIAFQGRIEF
jgi:hypothetical protein